MKKSTIPILVITICSLLASCQRELSAPTPSEENTQFSGDGFTLSHPPTIGVVKRSVHDFDIYKFFHQGLPIPILSAYVGNHPDFQYDSQTASSKSKGVINGMPCARVQIMVGNMPVSTNVLIEFPDDRMWPMYMHFWYALLPPGLQGIAEDIINSVRAQEAGSVPVPVELLEKTIQQMKESLKAAQEAGEKIDPGFTAQIEEMEQMVKRAKEKGEY